MLFLIVINHYYFLAQKKNHAKKIIRRTKKMGRKNQRNLKSIGKKKNVGKKGSNPRLKKLRPPMRPLRQPLPVLTRQPLMPSPAQVVVLRLLIRSTNHFMVNLMTKLMSPKIRTCQIWIWKRSQKAVRPVVIRKKSVAKREPHLFWNPENTSLSHLWVR